MRAIVDGLFDGMMRSGRSDSELCHRPVGSATECHGLEDSPCVRTIDIASHRAPELHCRVGNKLQSQVSSGVALLGSLSKRDLHFFKQLLPLRLRDLNGGFCTR
jgi:hypothetical protein